MMRRTALFLFLITTLFAGAASAQQAVRFDEPGAYLEVPHSATLETPELTIEFWLRVNDIGNPDLAGGEQTVFDKRGDDGSGYNFRLAGDEFPLSMFAFVEAGGVGAYGVIGRYLWTHFAVAQTTDSLKLYVDGQLAAADTNRHGLISTYPLRVGEFRAYPAAYFGLRGELDEVRIWDHARSVDSIRTYLHEELTGAEAGLAAYWDFENESDRWIPDRSPNGNDAEMFGNVGLVPSDAPIGFVPPAPPTALRALGTSTSIELAWQPSGDEVAEYRVHRGDSPDFKPGPENILTSLPGETPEYVDHQVVPHYNYYYRILAIDSNGHASNPGNAALGRVWVPQDYLTGVYYLSGFDPADTTRDWEGAYVRDFLEPAQPPMLGHYSSRDPSVIRQHLDWMASYGIDFFVPEWWQQDSWEDVTVRDFILPEMADSKVQFSLLYLIDNFWGELGLVIDADIQQHMVDDFSYMADTYFNHPNYLRIGGRPVVFLSGSRHLPPNDNRPLVKPRRPLSDIPANGRFL